MSEINKRAFNIQTLQHFQTQQCIQLQQLRNHSEFLYKIQKNIKKLSQTLKNLEILSDNNYNYLTNMLKGVLYFKLETFSARVLGPLFRRTGQSLYASGTALQGHLSNEDRLVPSVRCVPISDAKYPRLLDADWVAPNATVIGDVRLGAGASLWHGVVARGDTASIEVGKNAIVQYTSNRTVGDKVIVGENAYVGANAILDACTLEPFAYVGMGASVGKGSVIESFSVVAAGAQVGENSVVPSGQIWAGTPARYLRDLTQEEKHLISEHHLEMQQLSQIYAEETEKSFREIIEHKEALIRYQRADPSQKAEDKAAEHGVPVTHEDLDYIEHRVYHDYVGTVDYDIRDPAHTEGSQDKAWLPYEQDMTHYPEVFKQYQENYARFDQVKKRFETEQPFVEQGASPFTRKMPKDMSPWEKRYDDVMPKYTGTLCQ